MPHNKNKARKTRGPFLKFSTVRQKIYWRIGLDFKNEPRVFYLIAQNFKNS